MSIIRFLIPAILCVAVMNAHAGAQAYPAAPEFPAGRADGRARSFDIFIPIIYSPSVRWSGQGGSGLDLHAAWGIGYGLGYNLNEHFQLNSTLSWSDRDYTATIGNSDGSKSQYKNSLNSFSFFLNGVFYFFKGNITPFISAGLGATYLDTNIQTGAATTECWWDPWLGYECAVSVPTRSETDFSYNAGLGVRFDLSDRYSLQSSFNKMWIDIRRSSGTPDLDVWRLDFVFRVP